MKGTEITQAELKERFSYDEELGVLLHKKKSRLFSPGDIAGSFKSSEYPKLGIDGCYYQIHRLIWLYVYGVWPTGQIDHINRQRNDNRLCNLRDVAPMENSHNVSLSRRNKSGCLGVTPCPDSGLWQARIGAKGKMLRLGRFEKLEDAVMARKAAEHIYHPSKPKDETP